MEGKTFEMSRMLSRFGLGSGGTRLRRWLAVDFLVAASMMTHPALAGEPVCEREEIQHRAYKNEKSNKPQDTAASFERELAACKDKLSNFDHLFLLVKIVRTHLEDPPNFESCRRVAERGLRLAEDSWAGEEINTWYGYCGGDCSKAACVACCKAGVKKHQEELKKHEEYRKLDAKFARWQKMSEEERDMEQSVPCDFAKARQMATRLDKAGFGGSALHVIAKYRRTCGKNSPAGEIAALANDEALVHYHQGDDSSCLKVLSGIADDVPGTAFNRTLCGGACSLNPGKCVKAAEVRSRGLAARALQQKLRERTQAWCSGHPPVDSGQPAWDLPGTPGWAIRSQGSDKLIWAGDINGDGLGDIVETWDGYWEDTSNAALDDALPEGAFAKVTWKAYRVLIGCPKLGLYAEVMERNTEYDTDSDNNHPDEPDDKIAIRVLDQPGRTIRSVCVYPSRHLKCTASKCNREADQCADLSEWEKIEKPARRKP